MKLELWLKHHLASKLNLNLEILHTLKRPAKCRSFFLTTFLWLNFCFWKNLIKFCDFLNFEITQTRKFNTIINKSFNYLKFKMSPIFKCLICRKDIERSTKTFWIKKGHLLCSTCLDNFDKNSLNNNKISTKS